MGAALLGGAGLLPLGCRGYDVPSPLSHLDARDATVLRALAEAADPSFGSGVIEIAPQIVSWIDHWMEGADAAFVARLRGGLRLLEVSPALVGRGLRRFSVQTVDARLETLDALVHSRLATLRLLSRQLTELVHFAIYSQSGSWREIGYDGPWVGRSISGPLP